MKWRSVLSWRLLLVVVLLPSRAAAQDVTEYYGVDALGSVRVVFDSAGNLVNRMDYGPFGEQLAGSTFSRRVYAQLFRDGETGQDYAEARMYQSRTGRMNAPDAVFAALFDPQRLNRYAYALNNPLSFTDPSGLSTCTHDPETGRTNCDGGVVDVDGRLPGGTRGGGGGSGSGGGSDGSEGGCTPFPTALMAADCGGGGGEEGGGQGNPVPPPVPAPPVPAPPVPPPPAPPGPPVGGPQAYAPFTRTQCNAIQTVLDRERRYGTDVAARMSSNTFGDRTLTPFNSTNVPNLQTPVGELDLDWYTDLTAHRTMFNATTGGPIVIYTGAKAAWTVMRYAAGVPVANPVPFRDPGERRAVAMSAAYNYSDIFTPDYLAQVCR